MTTDRKINLSAAEIGDINAAVARAMAAMSAQFNAGFASSYDEDAGVWRTTGDTPSHVSHLLMLAHDVVTRIDRLFSLRRAEAEKAFDGIRFVRAAVERDGWGMSTADGDLFISNDCDGIFANAVGILWQYGLLQVGAPSPEAQAQRKAAEMAESGDSPESYAKPEDRAAARAELVAQLIERETETVRRLQKTLRKLMGI